MSTFPSPDQPAPAVVWLPGGPPLGTFALRQPAHVFSPHGFGSAEATGLGWDEVAGDRWSSVSLLADPGTARTVFVEMLVSSYRSMCPDAEVVFLSETEADEALIGRKLATTRREIDPPEPVRLVVIEADESVPKFAEAIAQVGRAAGWSMLLVTTPRCLDGFIRPRSLRLSTVIAVAMDEISPSPVAKGAVVAAFEAGMRTPAEISAVCEAVVGGAPLEWALSYGTAERVEVAR